MSRALVLMLALGACSGDRELSLHMQQPTCLFLCLSVMVTHKHNIDLEAPPPPPPRPLVRAR